MAANLTDQELKILILFAVKNAGGAIANESLCDILVEADINYIRAKNCIALLEQEENLISLEDEGEVFVKIPKKTSIAVEELKKYVPVTIRESVAAATAKEISRLRKNLSVITNIEKNEQTDDYTVSLTLKDDGKVIFQASLYTPTKMQAEIISNNFNKDSNKIYKNIIATLTGK